MNSTNENKHQTQNPILRFAISRFFSTVFGLLPDVNTVFDAGCGEGYSALEFQKHKANLEINGVDISQVALERAAKINPNIKTCVADVTKLPFADNCADLVVSFEVLEHLPDPDSAIKSYKRISRRYLLISTPNEPLFRLLRMVRGDNIRQWGNHPEHINHWNLFSFQKFLSKHGLKVIKANSPVPFIWSIVLCEIED